MHLELPIASFICALLSLAPLPWQWRAGTVPTVAISLWLFIANIINGVNTTVWAGNVRIIAPIWCDISTKVIFGANIAIPASIFCLCIHLERVSSIRQVSTGHSQKRRRQCFDAFMCFGLPMIYMALHYVVQGHRFDLLEDFGCRPSIYVSIPYVFLVSLPPLIFALGAFVLSFLAFRNFWLRRITFAAHLQNSQSALTPSRYFRLMAMSTVQMFWGAGVAAFSMWFTLRQGIRPWISWADVHFNFSRISVYPTIIIPPRDLFYTYMLWWTIPLSTFFFFIFFSFGQDAVKEYTACGLWVKRTIFRVSSPKEKVKPIGSLPSYALTNNIPLSPVPSSPPSYEGYQWDPPKSSPSFTTTSTHHASPDTYIFKGNFKAKDAESWADAQSISSYCSTHKP